MTVRVEWRERIAVVTIDRPARRNAVDHPTLLALRAAQVEAAERGVRCAVLTGAPPAFCAGADLSGVEDGEFTRALGDVLGGFGAQPFPWVAAVDGPALGAGTQLAIACDLRVATPASRFGIPAAKLGLAVDQWTVERLVAEVGAARARNMLISASTYSAAELHPGGFVHRLGGLDEAIAWAEEIAALAPLTIAAHKVAVEHVIRPGRPDAAVTAARERAWASNDASEGREAFLAKRPARFTGS